MSYKYTIQNLIMAVKSNEKLAINYTTKFIDDKI